MCVCVCVCVCVCMYIRACVHNNYVCECMHTIEKELNTPFSALLEQLLNCVDLRLTRERGVGRSGSRRDEEEKE